MKHTFILFLFFILTPTTVFSDEALNAYNNGDYATAYQLWLPRAKSGEAYAQSFLGFMYNNGHGVTQDNKKALYWFQKAADQHDKAAQNNLGTMYRDGRGITQNYQQALTWFRKAEAQGYSTAQTNLGWMYLDGHGVTQNDKKAVFWFRKAALQGNNDGQFKLGWMYDVGRGVTQDDKQAVSWYRKAAEQKQKTAQTNLGWMYLDGRGVPKDDEQAVFWFRKAANQGYGDGQFKLGWMYDTGRGVKQDYKQALSWYQKSATQNNKHAQVNLGWMYERGHGVTQDHKQAVIWYQKSAMQNHKIGIRTLQNLLTELGYDIGPSDGIYNSKTQNTVQKFLSSTDSKDIYYSPLKKENKVVTIKNRSGKHITAYQGSYALIIGVSEYTHGWSKLPSVLNETASIKVALEKKGFKVTYVLNPNHEALEDAFDKFIKKYGYDVQNRLLFFFSGHGHSRNKHSKGYLVPTNAPDPRTDEKGFLRKALSMTQILSWSREIEAKHALFLFDSCFSGSLFKSKSKADIPLHITDLTARPVRQYITAGDAGETVPAKSVFAPAFIKALRGEADLSKDGYITGSELGAYLHDKVIDYRTGQTPQYGKIRDPDLDEGDFVFSVK